MLLADEPTGNLDSKSATTSSSCSPQLHRDRGMTIVMITHDDKLGERAERTIRLQDGKLKSDIDRRAAKASAPPPSGGNGSVAPMPAPLPPATVPLPTIPTVGSGPRPSCAAEERPAAVRRAIMIHSPSGRGFGATAFKQLPAFLHLQLRSLALGLGSWPPHLHDKDRRPKT